MRNRTAQARWVAFSGDIAERVRHLENLVLSLGARNSGLQNQSAGSAAIRGAVPDNDDGQEGLGTLSQEIGAPGTMFGDQMGTRWFDDTHWQAIMDDVGACGERTCRWVFFCSKANTTKDNRAQGLHRYPRRSMRRPPSRHRRGRELRPDIVFWPVTFDEPV